MRSANLLTDKNTSSHSLFAASFRDKQQPAVRTEDDIHDMPSGDIEFSFPGGTFWEEQAPHCIICQCDEGELIIPCLCSGSEKHMHRDCLAWWLTLKHNTENLHNRHRESCPSCGCILSYEVRTFKKCLMKPCDFGAVQSRRVYAALISVAVVFFIAFLLSVHLVT